MYYGQHKHVLDQLKDPGIRFAYIDLFCGAGGTSTGVNRSKYARVVACVNHDKNAIASHAANHPNALHFVEDIRAIRLGPIIQLIQDIRSQFPHIKIVLWASLECTNFSKAKGGMPRDADSRTLAEHLYRYIGSFDPDYVQIENVVEFMAWGPLDENGKPVSRKNGSDWLRWREKIRSYGYQDDWRELDSANFGANTSRNRLFGVFAKQGEPIIWPDPTHAKNPGKANLFGAVLKKWRPVRECLDFSKEGVSIFNRKKPLVNATLERIYAGLVKFVANGDDAFISKYFSGSTMDKNQSLDAPAPTVTTIPHESVVYITKYNSTQANGKVSPGFSVNEPCHTITTQQRLALTPVDFLLKFNNGQDGLPTEAPAPTLTTKDKLGVILIKYHGHGENVVDPEGPCSTLSTKDRVAAVFIDRPFTSGGGKHVSVDGPIGALTTVPKANLIECERWILTNHGDKPGSSIESPSPTILASGMKKYLISTNYAGISRGMDEPAPTITANRKYHYLVNPQFKNKGASTEKPCFTLIARMDKMPPYLATAETGEAEIIIYEDDPLIMKKIKLFMAHYGIVDIKMRMLLIPELLRIQGFGDGYILKGTQTEQKKYIGNAVVPHVVEAWVNAMGEKFESIHKVA